MRAAQAVAAALSELSTGSDLRVEDLLERGAPLYRHLYRSAYLFLARRFPRLLDHLYAFSDSMPFGLSRLLPVIDRLPFREFLGRLAQDPPDLVLCTHFLPLEILAPLRLSGALPAPLWAIVTDLHPHGIWLWPGVDHYIVADGESVGALRRRGCRATVSSPGIPVHPDFSKVAERKLLLGRLGLPDRRTVLVLSGGEGVGDLPAALDSFAGFPGELTLIAIAGKNATLLEACHRWARTHESRWLTVRTMGFVDNMADWMAASDVMVTKPGGLTLFEAMALGKPLVLLPARGGQEVINRRWAIASGAAVGCDATRRAGSVVRTLFSDPDCLSRMATASSRAGRPEAATLIARDVLRCLVPESIHDRRLS